MRNKIGWGFMVWNSVFDRWRIGLSVPLLGYFWWSRPLFHWTVCVVVVDCVPSLHSTGAVCVYWHWQTQVVSGAKPTPWKNSALPSKHIHSILNTTRSYFLPILRVLLFFQIFHFLFLNKWIFNFWHYIRTWL